MSHLIAALSNPIAALLYFVVVTFIAAAPLWLPVVFLAFVLGRRQMSLQLLFFFIAAEAISIGVVTALIVVTNLAWSVLDVMRYRLRTLVIVTALAPPVLAWRGGLFRRCLYTH